MDNRPGNELKGKIHHLGMDYLLVPLSLPAVEKKQHKHMKINNRDTYNETYRHLQDQRYN